MSTSVAPHSAFTFDPPEAGAHFFQCSSFEGHSRDTSDPVRFDLDDRTSCAAWNKLTAEEGRLTSLTWTPWTPRNTPSQIL